MAVGLLFDAHVDRAIVSQLRLRHVDVRTAQEEGIDRSSDEMLLDHAGHLGWPLVTHDVRLHAMAEQWQRQGRPFSGVIFGHLMHVSSGQFVRDLELIANATESSDWQSAVLRLPL